MKLLLKVLVAIAISYVYFQTVGIVSYCVAEPLHDFITSETGQLWIKTSIYCATVLFAFVTPWLPMLFLVCASQTEDGLSMIILSILFACLAFPTLTQAVDVISINGFDIEQLGNVYYNTMHQSNAGPAQLLNLSFFNMVAIIVLLATPLLTAATTVLGAWLILLQIVVK